MLLYGQVTLEFWHEEDPVQLKLPVSVMGSVMVVPEQEDELLQFIAQSLLIGQVILALLHDEDPVQFKLALSMLGSVMAALLQEYVPLQLKHSLPRPQIMVEDWQA